MDLKTDLQTLLVISLGSYWGQSKAKRACSQAKQKMYYVLKGSIKDMYSQTTEANSI